MTIEETIWNEGRHEKLHANVAGTYPEGIHGAITAGLQNEGFTIRCVSPIAEGLPPFFEVPQSEMYGEPFDIPVPDELIFLSWFKGGEVFRSGCTFPRGRGRIFFFGPGHETFPIYHNRYVHRVIANAVRWAKQPHPDGRILSNWHRAVPIHR